MKTLRNKIEDCLIIFDHSTEAWLALMVALVVPSGVFGLGEWWLSSLNISGPYGPIVEAVIRPGSYLLMALAGLLQIRLGALALTQYRKAKQRLTR